MRSEREDAARGRAVPKRVDDQRLVDTAHLFEDAVVELEELEGAGEQPFTLGRERDLSGRPDEQLHAELAFQPGDAAAQCLLGDVEARRSAPEVLFSSDGDEATQQPRVDVPHPSEQDKRTLALANAD